METRERLFRAAIELFVERGYDATTMDDIAERADTARRTAFNHFATKSEISVEWASRRRIRAAEAARMKYGNGGTALDRLRAYFQELARITEEAPNETREMVINWLVAGGPIFNRTPLPQELNDWLEASGSAEGVRWNLGPIAAEVLYDVYLGVVFRWARDAPATPGAFTQQLDAAIDLVLAGVDPECRHDEAAGRGG